MGWVYRRSSGSAADDVGRFEVGRPSSRQVAGQHHKGVSDRGSQEVVKDGRFDDNVVSRRSPYADRQFGQAESEEEPDDPTHEGSSGGNDEALPEKYSGNVRPLVAHGAEDRDLAGLFHDDDGQHTEHPQPETNSRMETVKADETRRSWNTSSQTFPPLPGGRVVAGDLLYMEGVFPGTVVVVEANLDEGGAKRLAQQGTGGAKVGEQTDFVDVPDSGFVDGGNGEFPGGITGFDQDFVARIQTISITPSRR